MSLKSGHRIIPVTGEENQKQLEDFHGNRVGTVRYQPDGWFFTTPFIELADRTYDFKFKPSDVVLMTYPKCGTTWTQEIVWTLLNNPNLDNPKATEQVNVRCPFLEFDSIMKNLEKNVETPGNFFYDMFVKLHPERNPADGIFLQFAEFVEDPRIIKTHLPFSLLSPALLDTAKVIYVARNPRDVAVSYCHHSRLIKAHNFKGSLSEFVDHFVNDTLMYSPYWTMLKEAWKKRDHTNLLYCFYEDMKADPKAEITRIHDFLGAKLTEKQIDDIVNYTSFGIMKVREEKNFLKPLSNDVFNAEVEEKEGGFFRKGESGDWKTKLSVEDIAKLDEWTRKYTDDFDGDFKYKPK